METRPEKGSEAVQGGGPLSPGVVQMRGREELSCKGLPLGAGLWWAACGAAWQLNVSVVWAGTSVIGEEGSPHAS